MKRDGDIASSFLQESAIKWDYREVHTPSKNLMES
jgi:hypothetical protein